MKTSLLVLFAVSFLLITSSEYDDDYGDVFAEEEPEIITVPTSDIFVVMTDHVRYNVPYHITNGTMKNMTSHCELSSLVIQVNSNGNGELILEIPRELLDKGGRDGGGEYNDFFVILDGEEIDFEENKYDNTREIIIQLTLDSKELEIIGTIPYPEAGIDVCKIIHNPPYSYILPPLKQLERTADIHKIVCKDHQQLIFKKDVWSPACVNEDSVSKLIKRGWAAEHDPAHTDMMVATDSKAIKDKWTASYYLNYLPLPNEEFEENIEKVILWNMLNELEKHGIENWRNDPDTGAHTDEGWMNPSRMCSKIFLEDGTGHFVSAEFYSQPELNITKIIIDDSRPADCQKWFWIPYEIKFENGIMVYKYEKLIETKPQTTNN